MMMNESFAMAAHNLDADPHFHALLFYGKNPPHEQGEQNKDQRTR